MSRTTTASRSARIARRTAQPWPCRPTTSSTQSRSLAPPATRWSGIPSSRGARELLELTASLAADFLDSLDERPVFPAASLEELRAALGSPLPDDPIEPARVVRELAEAANPGVVAMAGGRYFGFVIGGAVPAALAADWLVSAWDQNAGLYVGGPAVSVAEEVAGGWLRELLRLPETASFGFVTGCQMAHVTALAAARHRVLADAGWDVNRDGLAGSPPDSAT